MTINRRFAWVAVLVLLTLFAVSCGGKNLVSLAKLDKGDIAVRDRFGNQVTVSNPEAFRKALKEAKKVADPKDQGGTTRADYVIVGDSGMVAYDWDGQYLVYTDGQNKRQVFKGDLSSLISDLAGLPPRIVTGKDLDVTLSPAFAELAKTSDPWAAAFSSQGKQLLMITAGKVSSAGFSIELEKAEVGQDGTLALTVRLNSPKGGSATVTSYPYLEVAVEGNQEIDVRMIRLGTSGERVEHVGLTKIESGQKILPVRPERGSLVLERLTVAGFVKGGGSVDVAVEDGYNVLGRKTVSASGEGQWVYFESGLDIALPSNSHGKVYFSATVDGETAEVEVPIAFSGK
ncbi:MAG: protease complex subunit PrcB family protein [Bacillota bacterium]